MLIRELLWDEWNEEHIAGHGVTPAEVEETCAGPVSYAVMMRARRYRVIGRTDAGRYLMIILDSSGRGRFYVVTARDATATERRQAGKMRG